MDTSWLLDQAGFLAAVIFPAVILAGVARKPLPACRCARCGYDLAGLAAAAPCPECASPDRGRRGPIWSASTWSYTPRRAAWSLGLAPIAIAAALAMPLLVGNAWSAAEYLLGLASGATRSYSEMHICFSLAYIGAFAMATVPLARLTPARGFAAAAALIILGAGVQLCYLAADSIGGTIWWGDVANRQRFVFIVFGLVLAALTVAAVDPAFRAQTARQPR